jgi:hypothetical protein
MSEVNGAVELKTNRKSNDLRYCNTKFLRMSLMGQSRHFAPQQKSVFT